MPTPKRETHAPNWSSLLDCTDKGAIRSTLANAVTVLQKDPALSADIIHYDEFLDRIITTGREWRDDDDTRLTVYLQQAIGMLSVPETIVASAVRHVARQRSRHCVRDWLTSLPAWDGVPRIALAFEEHWGAECSELQSTDYVRAVSSNFFIALIARVFQPGCQFDHMVVFEGAQGIGKSRALRLLGAPWYMLAAESVSHKDFFQALPGAWLVEIGELEAFSRAERERVKMAISTPADKYRQSYGRYAATHPRQCVFAGTTNRDDWGNDDTGLRRFWPVHCTEIHIDDITTLKGQWFAEALQRYHAGESWWETPTADAAAVQADRQHEDVWTLTVRDWLAGRPDCTSAEVLIDALKFREADIGRPEQLRIASILRLTKWKRQTIRRKTIPVKGWVDTLREPETSTF